MRRELCIVALLCIAGCQTETKKPTTLPVALQDTSSQFVDSGSAVALVFEPAIAPIDGNLDLSRDSRQPTAFLGYEDLIREYIYIRTDDHWTGDGNDRYERRAVTEKIGTLTR